MDTKETSNMLRRSTSDSGIYLKYGRPEQANGMGNWYDPACHVNAAIRGQRLEEQARIRQAQEKTKGAAAAAPADKEARGFSR